MGPLFSFSMHSLQFPHTLSRLVAQRGIPSEKLDRVPRQGNCHSRLVLITTQFHPETSAHGLILTSRVF